MLISSIHHCLGTKLMKQSRRGQHLVPERYELLKNQKILNFQF